MKIIKENKENLPLDFITSFVSRSWDEVGNLKANIDGIKSTFKNTDKVEPILQSLVDAYLVAIGQLEDILSTKKYLNLPDETTEAETAAQLKEDLSQEQKIELDKKDELEVLSYDDISDRASSKLDLSTANEDFDFTVDFDEPELGSEETNSDRQKWLREHN